MKCSADSEILTEDQIRLFLEFHGIKLRMRDDGERATIYWTRKGERYGWYLPLYTRSGAQRWPWTFAEWKELIAKIDANRAGWVADVGARDKFCESNRSDNLNEF